MTGKSEIIAGRYNSRSFNAPNDLAIDEAGRIYFTDPRYFGHEPIEQPVMGVYRIDPDGSVSRIINRAGMPNGILVSPDQQTLYVASIKPPLWYGLNALLAYDLAEDGSVSNRRVVVNFAACDTSYPPGLFLLIFKSQEGGPFNGKSSSETSSG